LERASPVAYWSCSAPFSTSVAGVVFSWLRLRSRSLVACVIAHFATNGVALAVAWFVVH
jgi:membrane protease YdiL (CAAX protease family)